MRMRCLNSRNKAYKWYGGKGITVCKRWSSFVRFLADMGERPEGFTLERINPDGHYEPGNCKWASWSEQRYNRSDSQNATLSNRRLRERESSIDLEGA